MPGTSNKAENEFFHALLRGGSTKVAVDLDADTANMLGMPAMEPGALDELENQASGVDELKPEPTPAPARIHPAMAPLLEQPPLAEVDENGPLEEPDRFDAEPAEDDDEAAIAVEQPTPARTLFGRLFTDKLAHPIQIMEVLDSRYQGAWDDWEPETLWWAIRRDFGPVGELARNKIGALTVAVKTDAPWLDWDVFEDSGLAWNDTVPIFGTYQPMSPMQMAFTVHILREIRADEPYANEVTAYIAAILDEHGWVYAPPEWFADAQQLLDRKQWLVGFRSDVMRAWERVRLVDPSTIDWGASDPLSIHLLRMHVVQRYLEERALLKQDISGVPSQVASVSASAP